MRSEQPSRADESAPSKPEESAPPIEVDVARTGGFAGITRRWTAQPPEDEASEWISLIDRCPWDDAPAPDDDRKAMRGAVPRAAPRQPIADGFVWWIRASWSGEPAGSHTREAELPDDAVTGAWRELIDAVRDWNRATRTP